MFFMDPENNIQKNKFLSYAFHFIMRAQLSHPKLDIRICDHNQHANIKLKPDINKNQFNFYKSFPLSFHSYFFT